jgi:acyl-CoA reductase-like NAD-dependent aldehyde dehydrogenase
MDLGKEMVTDCSRYFTISEAPGGAVKAGGIGRGHSQLGLMEMVHVKYAMRSKAWAPLR